MLLLFVAASITLSRVSANHKRVERLQKRDELARLLHSEFLLCRLKTNVGDAVGNIANHRVRDVLNFYDHLEVFHIAYVTVIFEDFVVHCTFRVNEKVAGYCDVDMRTNPIQIKYDDALLDPLAECASMYAQSKGLEFEVTRTEEASRFLNSRLPRSHYFMDN